jgi:hypothetical protein
LQPACRLQDLYSGSGSAAVKLAGFSKGGAVEAMLTFIPHASNWASMPISDVTNVNGRRRK